MTGNGHFIGNYFLMGKKVDILNKKYHWSVMDWGQQFEDSVQWRLGGDGIEIRPGEGGEAVIERTPGDPTTVLRIRGTFGDSISRWSNTFEVPSDLIVACIATETGGVADATREEPGFISDEETPNRVSAGLMQTLIETAQRMLPQCDVTREWLLDPDNSIRAGVAYMRHQKKKTFFDAPKVAAAYNAGGLYRDKRTTNRWRMRCYPLGTGRHIDKFVRFYNDSFSIGGEK